MFCTFYYINEINTIYKDLGRESLLCNSCITINFVKALNVRTTLFTMYSQTNTNIKSGDWIG